MQNKLYVIFFTISEEQMTYNEQLANVIKNHKNDTGNDWQAKAFRLLHEKYSLISLKDGFGDNNLKASIEKGWSKWCKEKNPNLPTSKDRCGICTGPASGILVLDVDNLEKFEAFCKSKGILCKFETFTVQTGKGWHLYFQCPSDGRDYGNLSREKDGFDVRGVLAPGSRHPKTQTVYEVVNPAEIAPAPQWLLNLYTDQSQQAAVQHQEASTLKNTLSWCELSPQEIAALENKLETLPYEIQKLIREGKPKGERSEASMSVMVSLLNNGYSQDEIRQIFLQFPIGDKMKENGEKYFMKEINRAMQFVNDNPPTNDNPPRKKKKEINIVLELYTNMLHFEYYVTEDKEYYVKVPSQYSNISLLNIDSEEFFGHANKYALLNYKKNLTQQQFKAILAMIKSDIPYTAKPIKTMNRFYQDEYRLLFDKGTQDNRCIQITAKGISCVQQPEIILVRNRLTSPVEAIDINARGITYLQELWKLFGISDELEQHFLNILLVSYLFDNIASPILYVHGQHGSGKTSFAKAIKNIFDPWEAGVSLPTKAEDLKLLLSTAAIGFIDNFSGLNKHTQDDFCLSYSNGISFSRKMYTDTDCVTLRMKCPLILSSINISKTLEHDFLSRVYFFGMKPKKSLKSNSEINALLSEYYPKIRGELMNLASQVFSLINKYEPLNKSRHADFDKLGQAYCNICGLGNFFYRAICENRKRNNALSQLEEDKMLSAFIKIICEKQIFIFRSSDMIQLIREEIDEEYIKNHQLFAKMLLSNLNILRDIGIVLIKGNKVPNGQTYLAYIEGTDIGNLSSPQGIADAYLAQSSPCNKIIDTLLK